MSQRNNLPVSKSLQDYPVNEDFSLLPAKSLHNSRIININEDLTGDRVIENHLMHTAEPAYINENSQLATQRAQLTAALTVSGSCSDRLLRLFVKNGEYVYARPNDIVLVESCDHLVKVYLAVNDKIKKTVRHNTLKDFLMQLPQEQFLRIGRFCAVNTLRLSGGNSNEQELEFDFKVSIRLKHSISKKAYGSIGI